MRKFAIFLTILGALSAPGPAAAADLSPGDADVAAAVARGVAMAKPHGGYYLKDYVVYAVPDARNIYPTRGNVDAVVLGTPLERIRHAAFFATYTGQKATPAEARKRADLPAGWLSFILFVHGPDAFDNSFATKYSVARLVFANKTLTAADMKHSPPSDTVYPLATVHRNRQAATVTYRFDLSALPDLHNSRARLQFIDDGGKSFDLPVDLSRYR